MNRYLLPLILCMIILPAIPHSVDNVAAQIEPESFLPERQPIRLDNVDQLQELQRIGNGYVNALAWSPDGTKLAAAGSIGVWIFENIGSTPRLLEGHQGIVNDVAWSPDSKWLASASNDTTVRVWDAETWETVHIFEGHQDAETAVAFSPDNRWLAVGADQSTLTIWDLESHEIIREFHDLNVDDYGGSERVTEILFTRNQSRIIWGTAYGGHVIGGSVWWWDLAEAAPEKILPITSIVRDLQFLDDEQQLFVYHQDVSPYIVEMNTGETAEIELLFPDEFPITTHNHGTITPDGNIIITVNQIEEIMLWDAETGAFLSWLRQGNILTGSWIQALELHPDGTLLAVAFKDRIELINLDSPTQVISLNVFQRIPGELVLSQNTAYLAVSTQYWEYPQEFQLWNLDTGERQIFMEGSEVGRPTMSGISFITNEFARERSDVDFRAVYRGLLLGCNLRYCRWTGLPDEREDPFYRYNYENVFRAQFSPEGDWSAMMQHQDEQYTFSLNSQHLEQPLIITGDEPIYAVEFSADSQYLVYKHGNQRFLMTLATQETRPLTSGSYTAYTPDYDIAVVADQQGWIGDGPYRDYANLLEIREAASGEILATLHSMTQDELWRATAPLITALDLSPDGKLLFVAMYTPEPASITEIVVWNMETYQQVAQFRAHTAAINDLIVSDDGTLFVTSSMDGTVRLWGVPD